MSPSLAALAAVCLAALWSAPAFTAAALYDGAPSYELRNYEPAADPSATVVSGNARFTVLTSKLIRMEYDPKGQFEDRATLAFLNRKLDVPQFTHSVANGVLSIATHDLSLSYTTGQEFTGKSLSIKGSWGTWFPGMASAGNLLGTIKSLDQLGVTPLNCTLNKDIRVHDESLHCEWGLVSRDGWSVVDDSSNWALTTGAEWWDSVNKDAVDWYMFGHGHEYKAALSDFTLVAGQIPLTPRGANGIWWTRWYDLNNLDVKKVVSDYSTRSIPLDIFVLDMDWHKKDNWGGFTFDPNLFPYPGDTMGYLHDLGLRTAANLHDANGIGNYEAEFDNMCKAMGLDPKTTTSIAFSMVNKTYVYSVEDIVLGALNKQGLDFWWIDWQLQQGGTQGGCAGGKQNPTIWTNKIRVTDPKRQGRNDRGLVLARWGGLGTHRYQVGFSGDVNGLTWENLAYQPYYSMTGTNVGYGFWSHDIEGPSSDHEMYVRWVQWACYSAVMRSHDRGMSAGGCYNGDPESCSDVRVWDIPTKYFEANRAAMTTRAELVPYIYTATRQAFDTGLSIIRPMYYEYPELDMAYKADENGTWAQYFFGDDMFVAPIVAPGNGSMTETSVWIPPGMFVEKDTGVLHTGAADGSTILTKQYALSEVPVFVRAGAVIPSRPIVTGNTIGRAEQQYEALTFTIYPGASNGTGRVYEDDAKTSAYLDGSLAWTTASYTRSPTSTSVTIVTNGSYAELPSTRKYTIRLVNCNPPTAVSVNDQVAPAITWSFDGPELTAVVETAAVNTAQPTTITVSYDAVDDGVMSGIVGGVRKANLAKRNLDQTRVTPGAHKPDGGKLMAVASAGDAFSYQARNDLAAFHSSVSGFKAAFAGAVAEVNNMTKVNAARWAYSKALLANAFN